MIETTTIHYATAGAYAIATVVLGILTFQKDASVRRFCYPFVALTGLAGLMSLAWAANIGQIPIGTGMIRIPQAITDYPTYAILFGFTVYLSGAGRRYIGGIVGLLLITRFAYDLVAIFDGVLASVANVAIIVGYGLAVVFLYGPIAKYATQQPPRQELLFKKTRNLIVFIFVMLVVWSQLEVTGILDQFTLSATLQYTNILFRVGFAAFVIRNIGVLNSEKKSTTTNNNSRRQPNSS